MSRLRHSPDEDVLVRFWSLDHHRAEEVLWPLSSWQKVVFAIEGTLHVSTEQSTHVLPSNRALWIESNEAHPARTLGKARVRTLYFAPHIEVARVNRVMEVRPIFRELIVEACRIGPLQKRDPRQAALAVLLEEEIRSAHHLPTSIPMPSDDLLRVWAKNFLTDPSIALPLGFSRRTIERRMLKETGLGLGQWCQQARALVGLQALSQGASVMESAVEAGFETTSGFIQSFRKQFGTTPGKMFKAKMS